MKRVLALSCLLSLTGCASIIGDHNYTVNVTSNVPDAEFVVKNKNGQVITKGTTPTIINLESSAGYFSGERYTFEAKKEGYRDNKSILDSNVSGSYLFGNILLGGIIGWFIVDPITGAMYSLPTKVNLELMPIDQKLVPVERLYRYQDDKLTSKLYVVMQKNSENQDCMISFFINRGKKAADFKEGEAAYFYLYSGVYNVRIQRSNGCEPGKDKEAEIKIDSRETVNITIQ